MGIAAALEQEFRDIVIVVIDRNHQRSGAFGRREIDISACGKKRFNAGETSASGRIKKRRKTTIRVILRARFRCYLRRPVVVSCPSVDRSALRNQNLHHFGCVTSSGSSPHQWRLFLDHFDDVDLSACINEHLKDREIAVLDGDHERGLSVRVCTLGA
jgi:hypothetical protein